MTKTLIIGSRRSTLAQIQSKLVRQMLLAAWDDLAVEIELIDTQGDLNRRDPLPAIGGKGLFTAELEAALLEKRIDLAVHSLKDLPVEDSPGLTVVAIPDRAPTGDMFICHRATHVEALAPGAVVGTSSLRRAAQILAIRPDLTIKDIRGNVETRLRKVTEQAYGYDATILAEAGLTRMGQTDLDYAHRLPDSLMLPAPGQGALGIQGRANDPETTRYLQVLDDGPTRAAVTAERAFLAGLGGGCSLPVGALGQIDGDQVSLRALVARPDGQQVIRVTGRAGVAAAQSLGARLVAEALAQGAAGLLGMK